MTSSDKKIFLSIGGHNLTVGGSKGIDMLLAMNGFGPFFVDETRCNFEIFLDADIEKTPFEPLYSFEFENIKCSYGNSGSKVIFTMTPDDPGIAPLILIEDSEQRISISEASSPTLLRFALWTAFNVLCSKHSTFAFHSSCIVYNNKAILFTGESGAGKSTHTRLWYNNIPNAFLLNDDSPIVRIEGGKVVAYGSPWSGKTPCFRAQKAEVAAVVRLGKADENKLQKVNALNSVIELHKSMPPMLSKDAHFSELEMSFLSSIANSVPIYHFDCRPELEAAIMIRDSVFGRKIVLSNKLAFSEILKQIESGESVTIPMHGTSMKPIIGNNDHISLSPVTGRLRKGDVVLFKYCGRHLLHRIIKIKGNTVILRGDASLNEEQIGRNDIVAILTGIRKENGKTIVCKGSSWQIKSFIAVCSKRIKLLIKSKKQS